MKVHARALFAGAVCLAGGGALAQTESAAWHSPQAVARLFQQACVLNNREESGAVDWALSEGFAPADTLQGNLDGLLSGRPGSVLAAPGSGGRVLLVSAQGRLCTVWAEQLPGPAVRAAVAATLAGLPGRSERLELMLDRSVERAGAWRNQLQWRYRVPGDTGSMALGAVTTLSTAPGTQALHAEPLPATPAYAPDGVPVR